MGKVISTFDNGRPGAISRAVDDIVTSYAYKDSEPLPFGTAVVLTDARDSIRKFTNGDTADAFLGFSVRSASKTPDTYGSNEAQYNKGEVADILVRGCMIVKVAQGVAIAGSKVYLKANGEVSANSTASGEPNIPIPAKFKTTQDPNSLAEIVLTQRAL